MSRRRRPPVRRCPRCGGEHCTWDANALCARCRRETAGDASALRELVHDARQLRLPMHDEPTPAADAEPSTSARSRHAGEDLQPKGMLRDDEPIPF